MRHLLLISLFYLSVGFANAQVSDGIVDLAPQSNRVTALSGPWHFYKEILSPDSIGSTKPSLVQVPAYWPLGDGYKGYGFGLYHLKVKGVREEILALRLERVHTSYSVWINDQLVHQSGLIADNPNQAIPGIDNKPIVFSAPDETFDLYIGVSNYSHARGGIIKLVEIGEANSMVQKWTKKLTWDLVFISVILAISLYSLVMFLVSHRQLPYLYFSLFCLFTIIRLISTESMVIGLIAPDISYYLITIFRYAGLFIGTALVGMYCEVLIPTLSRHWVVKLLVGVAVFCTVGVLIAPTWWGSYFSLLFQAVMLLSFLFFYPLTIRAILNGRKDLILISLSITAMIITFIHDSLVVAQILPPGFWQLYGFAIASLFQLLYFAFEYKSLNEKVSSLHSNFTSLGIIHREKSEFEHVLINEIKGQLNKEEMDQDFLRGVLKKINNGPSIPANQKVTIQAIDKVNEDFLVKLKKKYPDLTQKETELCLSLKAKLSTKEIASIRNMTSDSVKKARSRLRKKLSLEKETDLYQFFESF